MPHGSAMLTGHTRNRGRRMTKHFIQWRLVLPWVVGGVVIVAAGVMFPILYKGDHKAWDHKWSQACKERARLLESGFRQSFKMMDMLTQTLERFYIWPEVPQINQTEFRTYVGGFLPGTFLGNTALIRMVWPDEKSAYEEKRGHPIIDLFTGKPSPPRAFYSILELVESSAAESILGLDLGIGGHDNPSPMYPGLTPMEEMRMLVQTGIGVSPPSAASTSLIDVDKGIQYIFKAGRPLYKKYLSPNATLEEKLASLAGTFSCNFNVWSIVVDVTDTLENAGRLVVKIVDVTDRDKPPMPMYIPVERKGSKTTNSTFNDNTHKVPLIIGTGSRQHEIWCRPSLDQKFFPTRSFGYSAAVLFVGLSMAQLLWVHGKSITSREARCRDLLQLNTEMARAKQASDEHSAAKSAFVASVSHEIRTPMNGVLGMLALLIDTTELTPTQEDYASTALASGRALLSLINDILDLSKIEALCMELESLPFSLADEMDGILSMFGEVSRGKNLELATLVHPNVPPKLMGDPGRFRQIIINLIGNSIKFCQQGHIFVRIMAVSESDSLPQILEKFHSGKLIGDTLLSSEEEEQYLKQCRGQTLSGQEVCDIDCCWPSVSLAMAHHQKDASSQNYHLLIWVEDSGMGIADSAKERIFQPFAQADKSTARTHGGTGIGLNISKKLTELMSGKMDFTSQVMKGTTFRLHIQAKLPSSSDFSTNSSRQPSQRSSFHSVHPNRHSNTLPGNSAIAPSTTAEGFSSSQLYSKLLTALCIDNNPLRAAITCSYLLRAGITAHPLVLPFPAPNFGSELGVKPASAPATIPKEAPSVIFVEMDPSGGKWLSPISDNYGISSPASLGPSSHPVLRSELQGSVTARMPSRLAKRQPSVLCQRLAWARSFARQQVGSGEGQREVPVVLLANVQDAALEAEAKRAGFLCVVVKPLRKLTIEACLKEVLRRAGFDKLRPFQEDEEMPSNQRKIELDDSLAGKKVLVVDDNAVNRKVASKTLEKYKLDVTCRDSAEGAIKILDGDHSFQVILTDIQMPGMDGCEMTRAIRSAEKEGRSRGPDAMIHKTGVPIFAMTADVMKGSLDKFLECGMNGMVAKPIEETRLLQLIRESVFPECG